MSPLLAALVAASLANSPQRFVLHEWGTFTSIAGEDGTPIEWRPLAGPSDLPSFVYTPSTAGRRFEPRGKGQLSGTVRMETPVIYFYADKELEVSLKVGFPGGAITEWYPFARSTAAGIDWGKFKVRPHTFPVLPAEPARSHYYPAREVDAAPVQVCGEGGKLEHEKFLFYRGVGTFRLPLQVKLEGHAIDLSGFSGKVILFEREGDRAGVRVIDAGGDVRSSRPELTGRVEDAHAAVLKVLLTTGLYEKEARAMIATWRDTWFEDGLRALYVVPGATTDALLPITVSPQPTETVRVLVGRIELLAPERVTELRTALAAARKLRPSAQRAGEESLHVKHGRFAEPLLTRAITLATDAKERAHLEAVLARWIAETSPTLATVQ